MSATDDATGGLFVHRSSRTENLAALLARALEESVPANPLAPQTIVVAHSGLRRWLLGEFARRAPRRGGHGIAANFDMILPWQWLERTAQHVLGDSAFSGGAYRREILRWRIYGVLPQIDAAAISAYFETPDAARRRFQLAEHLAGIYSQYLIYRPDWILDWERDPAGHDWQAEVWRRVRATVSEPHRAHRRDVLLKRLADHGDGEAEALHVFGVSHLAPDILAALRAAALHRPVHLYFPDPCRDYWVDLRSPRQMALSQDDPAALHFEVRHPLLVSLGRIAQDFGLALEDCNGIDETDPADEADAPDPGASLLVQLQSSIRCCEPQRVGMAGAGAGDEASRLHAMHEDASLRVHACRARLRELEVLRDALLDRLARDPGLHHRDIVVMAPAIEAYAPYLAAVFGEPAQYSDDPAQIPWHLADVGLRRRHPLMSAFTDLLDLPESRFAMSELMDLLDVPSIARRFGIDGEDREALARWLRQARVAWGLDAEMKAASGAAAVDANSWKFGLDRLYAGLLFGDDPGDALFDDILPVQGVSGTSVDAIGGLDRLLETLGQARAGMAEERPLDGWCDWLLGLLDMLFLPDSRDEAESAALDGLRRVIAELSAQADAAGDNAELPWRVVREALRGALDDVSQRQPFLLGGVTFCGLVPQRSIPFRVVCLLGMNEGEFPRPGSDTGLNRMLTQPRHGDRDTRSEDRYLFLEALMAAREYLHISFIGEDARDGERRNPAAPLADLLQFLDERHGLYEADSPRPWLVRHPLQPFDARYFEHATGNDAAGMQRHDPRLFSYSEALARRLPQSSHVDGTFIDLQDASDVPVAAAGEDLSLAGLKRFWRNPARALLRDGLGLSLDALDTDTWPDREPLEGSLDRRERIERRLLLDAIACGIDLPMSLPPWLARSGLLAAGVIGERTWQQIRQRAAPLLVRARECLGDNAQPCAQTVEFELDDAARVVGTVENVYRNRQGHRLLFGLSPRRPADFREMLAFYLDFAALRLCGIGDIDAEFVEPARNGTAAQRPAILDAITAQSPQQLRAGLQRLIAAIRSQATRSLLFFPRTAWAWVTAAPDRRDALARSVWIGSERQVGERDYAPGYAALLSRDLDIFDPDSVAYARFVQASRIMADVLDPSRSVLFPDPAGAPRKAASPSNRARR